MPFAVPIVWTEQKDNLTDCSFCFTIIDDHNFKECGKNKSNENLKKTIASKNYRRPKTTGECGIFKIFG